jgi:hypothetical protein
MQMTEKPNWQIVTMGQHIQNNRDDPWEGWVAPGQHISINMMGRKRRKPSKKQVYWLSQGQVFPSYDDALRAHPLYQPIATREVRP